MLEINSEGDWPDKTPRNETKPEGKLSAEEFAALKEALSQINWEPLPKSSTKDYVAYGHGEKEQLGSIGFVGYKVKYWAGQIHTFSCSSGWSSAVACYKVKYWAGRSILARGMKGGKSITT